MSLNITESVVNAFMSSYEDVDNDVLLDDMIERLTIIYEAVIKEKANEPIIEEKAKKAGKKLPAKPKKEDKDEIEVVSEEKDKKKRAPTAYNMFVKEQMALMKGSDNVKDKMQKIGELWKEQKSK